MTDWKAYLVHFAPHLAEFLGPSAAEWKRVAAKMDSRLDAAEKALNGNEPLNARTTVHDLVVRTLLHDPIALGFLQFLDRLAEDLERLVPTSLHASIRKQARNLFLDFSDTDSHLLDKVGELCAIRYALESTGLRALGFETKVFSNSNATLDVTLAFHGGDPVSIEILNVWINDDRVADADGLNQFLDGRVARKILEKTKKPLPASERPFPLLMVLWFKHVETLRRIAPTLIARARGMELPICVLVQFVDQQGHKSWLCGSVASLIGQLEGKPSGATETPS